MCGYMAMHLVDKLKGWQGFIFRKEYTIICKKKKKALKKKHDPFNDFVNGLEFQINKNPTQNIAFDSNKSVDLLHLINNF